MLLGTAMQTYGDKVSDEQEILSWTSDVLTDTFAAESAVLRALQSHEAKHPTASLQADVARLFVSDAALRIEAAARQALAGMADGDTLRVLLAALRRLLKVAPVNTITIRRRIADATVEKGGYPLQFT
jgi:alkylation response protein AidB-like acyl-CoA dehydrogenase